MEDSRQERGSLRPSLNFTIAPSYCNEYGVEVPMKKSRMSRDPISHRIIEKRRRDRMNHCLAELSQLIPDKYLKQGQGRIEKTEIIELSIKHIKNLQARIDVLESGEKGKCCQDKFLMGFKECSGEVQRYLVETKGYPSDNPLCIGMLHHLQEQQKKFESSNDRTTLTAESVKGQDMAYLSMWSKSEGSQPKESTSTSTEESHKHTMVSPDGSVVPVCDSSMRSSHVNSSASSPKELEKYADNSAIIRKIDKRLQTMLSQGEGENPSTERITSRPHGMLHSPALSNCWSDSGYSGSFGAKTLSEDSLQQDADSRKHITYKYKNDIKLRFTADTSDEKRTCGEDIYFTREEQSPPTAKSKDNPSPQNDGVKSDSTSYPSSDFSTNGHTSSGSNGNGSNGSNGEGSTRSSSSPTMSSSSTVSGPSPTFDLANSVPGFALHPAGTYYIPVVSPASQLMPYLQNYGTSGICHPISIPVNFGGPLVCMQNIRVSPQSALGSGYTFKREGGHFSKRSSHSHRQH